MIKMNKKIKLGEILSRLGCGSKRDSRKQNKKYFLLFKLLIYFFYLYI